MSSGRRDRQAEWVGEPSVEVVVRLRHQLHELLVRWGLDQDAVEDAVLVVAELLANVVAHARTPFRLSVHLHGQLLRLSVSDRRVSVPAAGSSDNPTAGQMSGLRLVNALVFRWGWQEHETGKTVWAELIV